MLNVSGGCVVVVVDSVDVVCGTEEVVLVEFSTEVVVSGTVVVVS
jgi:hypothetical protein